MTFQSHLKPYLSVKKTELYPNIWTEKIMQVATTTVEYPKLDLQQARQKELKYSTHWSSISSFITK